MADNNLINDNNEIILGSGELYMVTFDGKTIPDDATIEADGNLAGNIKGGAKLDYSTESQTVSSDNGRVKATIIKEETVKLTTGLITWCLNWLKALIPTARIDATYSKGLRYKIGGLAHQNLERYLLRFVHTKRDGRKLRLTVTGVNTGSVGLSFDPENPTTIDAEITAEPLDSEGTLVYYDAELEKPSA